MADTFSLRFEIDASRAEAGAKKFVSAINSVNKSLDNLDAKAEAAFFKLMAGGSSGGDFTKLAKDLGKLNNVNINPAAIKSINSLGSAFKNLRAPSPAALKNITLFADTVPNLLNRFNVSGNFADSINKIGSAMAGFKVPSNSKIEALRTFGTAISQIAPSLRISGSFSGITKLGEALGGFRSPSEKAVSNMRAFFSALNNSGAKASISGSLVNGIVNLSSAFAGLKAPSSTSVKNIRDMFSALANLKPVSGTSSITKITQAFAGFKGPTPSQIKNVQAFVTMLGTLRVPPNIPQISAAIETIGAAAGRANSHLNNFRTNLGGMGAGRFGNEAKGLTTNLRGLENAFSGTFQAASVFRAMIGSITLGTLSKAVYDANTNFNAFKSTMLAVNDGSLSATGESMRYVEDMANRLGQRVTDIQESFGGFAVSASLAGVSTDQTRAIFESTITAMTVLHRSSDRTKLALLALEQMMSKGNVSSEELRRQLGEQLPGAVNLMARALKVNTSELNDMLKAGQVLSADALPKFAAEIQRTYGPSLAGSLKNATSQFNLLSNSIYDLFIIIGQSGAMDALAKALASVKEAISAPEFLTFADKFGTRTGVVIEKLGQAFSFLIKNMDSVINVLKVILAINIARFFQSFGTAILGSIASMGAWRTTVASLGTILTGLTTAANGATVAVGIFGRAAAVAQVMSGPIGLVTLALGALAAVWLSSSETAEEFTTVVDRSKEALDRYQDSISILTTTQLVVEQEKLRSKLEESQLAAKNAQTEFEKLLVVRNAEGGRWQEMKDLADTLANLRQHLNDTNQTYSAFASKLATTKWNTPEAEALAKAFLDAKVAAEVYGAESEFTAQKIERLNAVMNATNAAGFVGAMNSASSAAAAMADVVSAAANKVVEAQMRMNMSKAQSLVSDQLIDLAKEQKGAMEAIGKSEASIQDKRDAYTSQNLKYAKAQESITKSGEALLKINTKLDTKKQIQDDIEKMGNAATATGSKISELNKRIEALRGSSEGTSVQRTNAITQLQQQIADAEKAEAKKGGKGKKKGGGGGGAASAYLDDAAKSTLKYNKEQDALDKMLKKGQITQDQYNTALDKLKEKYAGTSAGANGLTSDFEKLKNELMPSSNAMAEFTKNQDLLKQAMDQGKITAAEYLDLLTRLQKKYSEARTGNSWVDGINKGLTDLTKTSDDFVNDVAGAVTNAFNGLEDALTEWVTTGKLDFKSLTQSILADVARIVIRYAVIQPIIKALSGLMGGMSGGSSGGGIWGAIAGAFSKNAKGNAFTNGKVTAFAKGGLTNGTNSGIVNSPTIFDMAGSKTGLMGEAGPEAIMPLKRTADGSLGVVASGAVQATASNVYVQPKVNVNVQNNGGNADASVSTKQNADGSLDINVLLEQVKAAVAGDVAKGGTNINKAFENRYGANPATGNRR